MSAQKGSQPTPLAPCSGRATARLQLSNSGSGLSVTPRLSLLAPRFVLDIEHITQIQVPLLSEVNYCASAESHTHVTFLRTHLPRQIPA